MSKDKPTFEDAVALLADRPTPTFLASNAAIFYAGLNDLAERVANLEHGQLEATFRTTQLEDASNATVTKLNAVETEHTDNKKRLDALEGKPVADTKRLDTMETRLRTVEGAVGSAGYKTALAKPVEDRPEIKSPFTGFTAKPVELPVAQPGDHPSA